MQGLLTGSEGNRVVKERRWLARESESSKALLPGCAANFHGCFRTLRATLGTRFRASRKNRRKPLENGPLTRKAESIFFQLVDELLNEELFESAAMNHERAVAWQTDHN